MTTRRRWKTIEILFVLDTQILSALRGSKKSDHTRSAPLLTFHPYRSSVEATESQKDDGPTISVDNNFFKDPHMYPNTLIQDIFERSQVTDERGNTHALRDGIDPKEGDLLLSLICQHKFTRTLEIGCAFGVSSLYICEALSRQGSGHHTILDPGQYSEFDGIGIAQLKRAGFECFELVEKPSEVALPSLLAEGRKFQFALIDGWHTFDHTLLDLFYVNRLLEEGGIVAIDDLHLHGVRRAVRYMLNYPNYEVIGSTEDFDRHQKAPVRRLVDGCMQGLGAVIPRRYLDQMFVSTRLNPDSSLGIKGSLIALRKTGPDPRGWDWYKEF